MKKLVGATLAAALVLTAPAPLLAQAKIRIAIWDFENHAENHWWFWNDLGPAARNQIDTSFSENAQLSAKFSVIEREKLALVIDTTTAERVLSISADGQVRKGGGFIRGTSLSRDAEWGIASETIQQAAGAIVEKLVGGSYLDKIGTAAGSTGGVDMRIIKVDGNRAYINVGASSGVKVGDKFVIFNVGEELVDPVSGAKLGAEERQTGTGAVTEVQERFAIMTVTGKAAAKDVIRTQR